MKAGKTVKWTQIFEQLCDTYVSEANESSWVSVKAVIVWEAPYLLILFMASVAAKMQLSNTPTDAINMRCHNALFEWKFIRAHSNAHLEAMHTWMFPGKTLRKLAMCNKSYRGGISGSIF